jgi:integrase
MASKRNGKGEGGQPFQRADGRWAAFVTIGYRAGKQEKLWVYGKTRRECADKRKRILSKSSSAVLPPEFSIRVTSSASCSVLTVFFSIA